MSLSTSLRNGEQRWNGNVVRNACVDSFFAAVHDGNVDPEKCMIEVMPIQLKRNQVLTNGTPRINLRDCGLDPRMCTDTLLSQLQKKFIRIPK